MTGAGWIVTASDFYTDLWDGESLMPFIMGKIEAANNIDLVRAAHHLMTEVGTPSGANAYDVVAWGHSQGGHASVWTGQLLEPYAAATATADSPSLALSGVVAEAPASVFVVRPGDPGPNSATDCWTGSSPWRCNAKAKRARWLDVLLHLPGLEALRRRRGGRSLGHACFPA